MRILSTASLAMVLAAAASLSTSLAAPPTPAKAVEPEAGRPTNRKALPDLAKALTALERNHDNLVFDNWHGASIDLAEFRRRLGLRDWSAPFSRERLLVGLEDIYSKVAGNAEMRLVLAQLEVREALRRELSAMMTPLGEDDPERKRMGSLFERLGKDLLVQANDDLHAIRLTGLGLLQRLRVEDRDTGKVLFEKWVGFDLRRDGKKTLLVMPKSFEELTPEVRRKVEAMLATNRLKPYLNCGC